MRWAFLVPLFALLAGCCTMEPIYVGLLIGMKNPFLTQQEADQWLHRIHLQCPKTPENENSPQEGCSQGKCSSGS